jgi:hypothetical protein
MVHVYDTKYNFHLMKSHRASTVAEDSEELECSGLQHGKTTVEVLAWIEQDGAETIPTLNRTNGAQEYCAESTTGEKTSSLLKNVIFLQYVVAT